MTKHLVRLRRACAESGDLGSAEARDMSIKAFLSELEQVVSGQVIDLMEDDKLRSLYVGWVTQLLSGLDDRSRVTWLAEGVTIAPARQGRKLEEVQTGNVFNLHA